MDTIPETTLPIEHSPITGPHNRRSFFRRAALTGAAVAPLIAAAAIGAPAAFADSGENEGSRRYFREIQSDENQHVQFLKSALMGAARPKPTFKGLIQANFNSFVTLSRTFENVGVGAYLMAAPAISSKTYLAAAGSILTIEARHAGYLDSITHVALSPNGAFDKPISQSTIVADVSPFIVSLNGGPNPANPLTSDYDILNFALLLEYLEAEFYNLNVPKFAGGDD